MSNSRTIEISLDHILSELAAFPLCSSIALKRPLINIDCSLKGATRHLWRQTEVHFASRFPHVSLDELISMRNSIWFGLRPQGCESLAEYLKRLASLWLISRGANAEPRYPGRSENNEPYDPVARRAWRWMTFSMPGDLLLAGLSHNGHGPVRVNMLAPSVEALLRNGGYAETHLHLGAALDFSTAWASAMNLVGRESGLTPHMKWDAFASAGADHDEGLCLSQWLIRAAIVRYFLGAFLRKRTKAHSFQSYMQGIDKVLRERFLNAIHFPVIRQAFNDLYRGELTTYSGNFSGSFKMSQRSYNALTRVSTQPFPEQLDDVQKLDPLSSFFKANGHSGPSIQLQFLQSGLHYLEQWPDDKLFATLFWQVERVRGQIYRHCVQRPLTPGLMNFIRFYDRKGAITGLLKDIEFESAGSLGGIGHGLTSLEVRSSPSSNYQSQLRELAQWKKQILKLRTRNHENGATQQHRRNGRLQTDAWRNVECGVVLHYLKFRGKQADRGTPLAFDQENHADPSAAQNASGFRWQAFTLQTLKHANAISHTLSRDPNLLFLLRGLDVCRDEHGVPTWVIAPMFKRVQEHVKLIAARERSYSKPELPRLRTTIHVGEDFVHLATGLRYMDEAIEHIPLFCGDRVGHGLALGIEPREWAQRAMRMAMPREDRWLDLIWERSWHGHHGSRFDSARRTYVEEEIIRLSEAIFGEGYTWTPHATANLISWLHNQRALRRLGFPGSMLSINTKSDSLELQLERYLTEPLVYRRCREIEWVSVADDSEALIELQRLVRLRYATTGITIEVNPISNLLIGDLADLKKHPLWRISPGLGNDVEATLRICVGSDDPLPFATTLPEEYQFLFDSLVLAGRSQAEAREWLGQIRQAGMESRFTTPPLPVDLVK
tara:strand:- start:1995 stop:4667 length:2673 start_codon:yes stop_codon:yes gene_type:complete